MAEIVKIPTRRPFPRAYVCETEDCGSLEFTPYDSGHLVCRWCGSILESVEVRERE